MKFLYTFLKYNKKNHEKNHMKNNNYNKFKKFFFNLF